MRTRTTVIVAAVTVALLAADATAAAAASQRSAATSAVEGRVFQAPRPGALVTRVSVRVVVRVPARTRRLSVRVGGRDVTARFSPRRGSRRFARVTPGDGLRYRELMPIAYDTVWYLNSDFEPQRSGLFLLGKTGAGTDYVPENLSDRMFQPLSQSGLGVHLPDFFWARYQTLPGASCQCG